MTNGEREPRRKLPKLISRNGLTEDMLKMPIGPGMCMITKGRWKCRSIDPEISMKTKTLSDRSG